MIELPFEPDALWGAKSQHHVTGTIDGMGFRAVIESRQGGHAARLGPAWLRDRPATIGDQVQVEIEPEGPQRDDLAPDVAAALDADPVAADFFDSLAQFYRRGYLRWIDATKRSPELRAERIAAMVEFLRAGVKDHRRQ